MTVSNDVQKKQSELPVILAANLAANRAMLSKAGDSAKRCLTAAAVQTEQNTNELALVKGQHDQLVIRNSETKLLLEASLEASSKYNGVLQNTINELNAELAAQEKQFQTSEEIIEKTHQAELNGFIVQINNLKEEIKNTQAELESQAKQVLAREKADREASDGTVKALKAQLQALKNQNVALRSRPKIPVLPPPPPPPPQETPEEMTRRIIREMGL